MLRSITLGILGFAFVSFLTFSNIAYARTDPSTGGGTPTTTSTAAPSNSAASDSSVRQTACKTTFFGIPTWYKYLKLNPDCSIDTEGMNGNVVVLIFMAVIEILLVISGLAAVGFIIYGAYKFILSQGDPQKIAGARTTVLNAIVGLALALIATPVISFIAGRLSS